MAWLEAAGPWLGAAGSEPLGLGSGPEGLGIAEAGDGLMHRGVEPMAWRIADILDGKRPHEFEPGLVATKPACLVRLRCWS